MKNKKNILHTSLLYGKFVSLGNVENVSSGGGDGAS